MRTVSRAEQVAAWTCGAGALALLLGWRNDESVALWGGAVGIVLGLLLWFRPRNRLKASQWIKENEEE